MLTMISELRWNAFTPRDQQVAEWIVGWSKDEDPGEEEAEARQALLSSVPQTERSPAR